MTEQEFRELFAQVSNWGAFAEHPERGALNHLTPDRVVAAARLVRTGVTVTLSLPLDTEDRIDNPEPADHHMTMLTDQDIGSGSVRFTKDYVGVDYHNEGHSHIDAFSHVAYQGCFYDGMPERVGHAGGRRGRVDRRLARRPRRPRRACSTCRGCAVFPGWSRESHVIGRGPRVGRARAGRAGRLRRHPAGAHRPRAPPRRAAALGHGRMRRRACIPRRPPSSRSGASRRSGRDGNNDTAPSTIEGVGFPIHVLAINAMGIHLLDYLQLEGLAQQCEQARRWEFLFTAAPLRLTRGTGSPLNPTAVF